jgi:hypothetical protein
MRNDLKADLFHPVYAVEKTCVLAFSADRDLNPGDTVEFTVPAVGEAGLRAVAITLQDSLEAGDALTFDASGSGIVALGKQPANSGWSHLEITGTIVAGANFGASTQPDGASDVGAVTPQSAIPASASVLPSDSSTDAAVQPAGGTQLAVISLLTE